MRSHEAAHAAGDAPRCGAAVDHPLVPSREPELITEREELEALIQELRRPPHDVLHGSNVDEVADILARPAFSYDSEFIGEETYYPRLCVIQVATAQRIVLIDALALESRGSGELIPFWELLADTSVEKIVHAGGQDLEPVVRHLGCSPANIFDVQVGAGFAGLPYPSSLTRLIAEVISAEAAGAVGAKFSQWDHRPLTPVQLQYAANDVRYLLLLRHRIGKMLRQLGNDQFALREFEEMCDPALYRFDGTQRLRVRAAERLGPVESAVLRSLLAWRDQLARQRDLPPRALIADGVLYDIARAGLHDVSDVRAVRGLPRPIKRAHAEAILNLVKSAIAEHAGSGEDTMQTPLPWKRPDYERERVKVNELWHAIRERAHERKIDPALVTSKRELTAYIRNRSWADESATQEASLRATRLIRQCGWRNELIGDLLT